MAPVSSLKRPSVGALTPTPEDVVAYDHPVLVLRLQNKLGLSVVEAETLFKDTLRFLYLCGTSPERLSPNEALDFGWHEFLLFTEDYANFCDAFFGFFIHHRPRHPNDPPAQTSGGKRAKDLAHSVFGDQLSANWNYPTLASDASDPCDSCGCASSCTDGE
jgi:hypothetical protein